MDKNQYEVYRENMNHTPMDFPYNVYLCSIPLDFRAVKTHWHDEIEIIVIKKGEGIVSVDLTDYEVHSGDIVFVHSGQLHSIGQKENCIMEYENILFKPVLLASSDDSCNDLFIHPLCTGSIRLHPLIGNTSSLHTALTALIAQMDAFCDSRPYGYQLAVKGLLFQLMFTLLSCSEVSDSNSHNKKSLEKIKTVLSYVEENYRNPISIEEIAKQCYYSKSYFMKFFKQTMGMGFTRYLNEYRLEIAAKLLLDTEDAILDIALQTGFEHLSYFNRSFKQKYGVSPGKYRKGGV